MSDHYVSVLKGTGLDPNRVVAGTSTSGQSVELRIHDGDGHTRLSVSLALDVLKAYLDRGGAVTP
jgi:hypothetical protein